MAQIPLCEHRRVELGRLYCDIATRRGERATNETFNRTCERCRVAAIRAAHPCAQLDVGIDLTEHRDRSTLDAYHLACRVTKLDVEDALGCTPECPYFEPIEEERREQYQATAQTQADRVTTDEATRRLGVSRQER
jgi:hypothetical protein